MHLHQKQNSDVRTRVTEQRDKVAAIDSEYFTVSERLRKLENRKEKVTRSFDKTKSSLETVKGEIDKLRQEKERLIGKRERKELSKCWFFKQRESKTGKDLVQLEEMIKEAEEAITELSNQIDELERKIKAQNELVTEMSAQLIQKEEEMKQLEIKLDKVQKEKSSCETKLVESRETFERDIEKMMNEQKLLKVLL